MLYLFSVLIVVGFSSLTGSVIFDSDDSGMEFCEGRRYYNVSTKTCPMGISFGTTNPPPCICVRGIYRAHMSNCEVADGFARDVCMLPYEVQPGQLLAPASNISTLVSIQILGEPDWDKSHLVVEPTEKNGNWTLYTYKKEKADEVIQSSADFFYVINGKTWISTKSRNSASLSICFEPNKDILVGTQICKVTRKLNMQTWFTNSMDIRLKSPNRCSEDQSNVLLNTELCMQPLTAGQDECELACDRNSPRSAAASNHSETLRSIFWENEYIERELREYALLVLHLETLPGVEINEPNKTLLLFKMMVEATTGFCPDRFVPKLWIIYMTELFYVLHKGRTFKYVEVMSADDYSTTKAILQKCISNNHRVILTNRLKGHGNPGEVKCSDGLALGYCASDDTSCLHPIPIQPMAEAMAHKVRRRHYVPETAWNILDATQAICFREFNSSYRMFHKLEHAVERLFTARIKNLWNFLIPSATQRHKNLLVGKGADDYMQNLEICTGSAYHIINSEAVARYGSRTVFLKRLTRPVRKILTRRRRETKEYTEKGLTRPVKHIGRFSEVYCRFKEPIGCSETEVGDFKKDKIPPPAPDA